MVNVISSNQNTTVAITTNDEQWRIENGVKITVANTYGILESGSGNTIKLLGDIEVTGNGFAGVRFQGSDSSLLVGANSVIDGSAADYGIFYEGAGGTIDIKGAVSGGKEAVHGNIWADLTNDGSITGTAGIAFDDSSSMITNNGSIDVAMVGIQSGAASTLISNTAGAKIIAGSVGIKITGMDGDAAVVANAGLIKSDVAVMDGDDALTLTNRGKIIGDVLLGGGDDIFDLRKGSVMGTIEGGAGDDRFRISSSLVKISENPGDGTDTVSSSATYQLGANLDRLVLKGGGDIDGTGNKGSNELVGNQGDNVLRGLNGGDLLDGKQGNDVLRGDLGADTFVFNQGYDKDRITDFGDGEDHIHSNMVTTQAEFDALDIKQVGADVVINFGNGDVLRIENLAESKLDFFDFN